MKLHWAGHILSTRSRKETEYAPDEELPEIKPGAFAAWARAERSREALRLAAGEACLLPDGRKGRVVEVLEGGRRTLVCRPV